MRYECTVGNLGHPYSSPLGAQRCSNLVRGSRYRGFRHGQRHDESRGARPLPSRELSQPHRGRLEGFLGAKTKSVIQGVEHGGALPDVVRAESARWLRALPMESRLLRWIACSGFGLPVHRGKEALAREFHLRLLVADR